MLRDRDSIDQVMPTRVTLTARTKRARRILLAAVLCVAPIVASTGDVQAQGKTAFLAEQLRKNSDFRVRVDAALKLGTSDDAAAVKPLCGCLGDQSEVEAVRVACAAALGKLKKPGGDGCLKEHVGDKSSKVREQVTTSLKALGGAAPAASAAGPSCPAPPAGSKAKYFVGVGVSNKTSRPDTDIKPIVEQKVVCKLQSMGRFKMTAETDPKKMAAAVSKEKLDGYFLNVSVEPIQYAGGNLKVSMKLTIMTHTRDLKGEIGKSLSMPGVGSPSKVDEDELIGMAADKLVNDFAGLKP